MNIFDKNNTEDNANDNGLTSSQSADEGVSSFDEIDRRNSDLESTSSETPNETNSYGTNYVFTNGKEPKFEASSHDVNRFNPNVRIELYLNENQETDFKKARKLSSIAMVCAVVSLFIGGMLLSLVGLGCAYFSFRRSKKHLGASGNVGMFAHAMKRTAITSAMFCAFSFVLNAFAAWQMLPYVMDMINSGTIGVSASGTGAVINSTWG